MLIAGSCHCGNIALQLQWPGEPEVIPARACACTFCTKHGAVWTAHRQSSLTVTIRDQAATASYSFGTETAAFHQCTRCGVVPFVTSPIDDTLYAVVNTNTFDNLDPSRLERATADFQGEAPDDRLARRQRSWIANVRITGAAESEQA